MEVSPDLLAQFIGVTNAPETLAAQLLRDAGLDLEAAIHSFFAIQEAGGVPSNSENPETASLPDSSPVIDVDAPPAPSTDEALARALADEDRRMDEEPVRAPLPQVVDTLLPSTGTRAEREPALPADPFATDGTEHGDGLAALFRPPTHLICSSSFETAMTSGQRQKRWLLINMQRSDVFACHVMNRDAWSDPVVQELLQRHFIFWQRDERAPDGARYKQFYRYDQPPHVALIDPRNGERLRVWGGDGEPIQSRSLLRALRNFVNTNSLDSEASIARESGMSSTRPVANTDGQMDEDAEIAAAIAASMEHSKLNQGDSDVDMQQEGDSEVEEVVPTGLPNGTGSSPATSDPSVVSPAPLAPVFGSAADRETSRLLSATNPALNRNRSLRAQQDDEFKESLALDRAKELSEKAEVLRVERAAAAEQTRVKNVAEAREAKRRRVPAIPEADCKEQITELAIRLPSGVRLQRRFLARDNIGNVYDYIESEHEELAEGSYELMLAYPKKSFTDREQLLEELAPKAALVVHLKD